MANIPSSARSAPTYPITEKLARRAVRLWFAGTPTLTLAQWRDDQCARHCEGLPDDPQRVQIFREAFARELRAIIAATNNARYRAVLKAIIQCPENVSVRTGQFLAEDGTTTPACLISTKVASVSNAGITNEAHHE